jgi:hypothetical protein
VHIFSKAKEQMAYSEFPETRCIAFITIKRLCPHRFLKPVALPRLPHFQTGRSRPESEKKAMKTRGRRINSPGNSTQG